MTKTQIALVRGSQIGRGEISWWNTKMGPRGYEVTGFASTRTALTDAEIGEPIQRLPSLSDFHTFVPGPAKRIFHAGLRHITAGAFSRLIGLEKTLKDYDIYYASETYRGYSAQCAEARLKYNRRLVVHVFENIPFAFEHNPILRRNKKITLRAADLFVAATERAAEVLKLEGVEPERIRVVYPGISISLFLPVDTNERLCLREKHGFRAEDILVLFVGRLHKTKGIQELLYAVDLLLQRRADLRNVLRLLFIGYGPEKKTIVRYVMTKGLEDNIILPGYIPHQTLREFYQFSDIFVLPSGIDKVWQEQFGKVLTEAMASGLPVATTYSGSIDEVMGDTALMVPPHDFYRLSQNIERLINDPDLRDELGKLGRKRVIERFDTNYEMEQMGDLFDEIRSRKT